MKTIYIVLIIALLGAMTVTPAAATTVTLSPDMDSEIAKGWPTDNFGGYTWLDVMFFEEGAMENTRSLIHFDLSSLPDGVTIDSATLHLYMAFTYADRIDNVHRITADWTETGVTWNNRDTGTPWTASGGDYVSTPTASTSTGTTADVWRGWDVTSNVQAFIDDTPNYGWLIKDGTEEGLEMFTGVTYTSREYTDPPLRPYLEVTYTEGAADPDLTPTSIATDSLSAGVPAAITVDVSNIGSADAGSFNVTLKVEETVIGSDTVASLGAGSSVPVVFTWTPDAAGSFNLTAIVDSEDAIAESDETNNGLTREVTVTPAAATTWDVYPGDSIQDALNTTSDGDTVLVHAGNYVLTEPHEWQISVNTPNITLKGEGADVVTLDGNGKTAISLGPTGYGFSGAASGCIVEGFRIINSSSGVSILVNSPNCIVRNNVIEANTAINVKASNTMIVSNVMTYGKFIQMQVSNTTFMNNVILNVSDTIASIYVYQSCDNLTLCNNTILNSQGAYGAIVLQDSSMHNISNNVIKDTTGAGILLYKSTAINTITKNSISSNGKGIWLYQCTGSDNKIYLNNLIDNTGGNVVATSTTTTNIWNSTSPIEYTHNGVIHTDYLGNYWSDYTGVDTSPEDGIGDTPYDIADIDNDYRPLMAPFENYLAEEEEPESTPPTSFLISGNITYDNGNPILNPTVTVRNMDTSEDFTVKTDAGSNYYRVLTDSSHVSAGNAILINASDDTVYNGATHIVTASEIEIGGFVQDMILESGDKPDLIVTEMSGEWVSLSTYNITYTVKNNGSMAADASTTSIRIDGTEVATEPVPALAIGESHTSTVGPFTLSGDNDTIEVCADSGNVINELDETNNCLSNLFEAPGIPDLIVWGIAKTPGDVSEENILGVRVKNIGTANAGSFDVSLSIDGTQVLLETVTSLAAGETTELEYTWTPAGAGEYALSAAVDTNNDVEEFDETNNDYARTSVIINSTDWAQFNYDASSIGFSPSSAPSSDTVKWISEDIVAGGGLSWGGISDMGPVVAGGKVFTYCGMEGFSSTLYDVACLDEETGELLWNVSLPYPMVHGSWAPLGYDDGMVFCTVNHYVVALDANDGSIVWECDLDSPEFEGHAWSVNSGPTIADGMVFAGTYDEGGIGGAGGLAGYVAIDEYTGEKLWQTTGDGHCDSTPAYYDGVVYAGFDYDYTASPSGGCYALDADTGEEVWTTWLPFSIWGSVSVDKDYVYGANYNFQGPAQVFILYRNNGTVKVISESLRTDSTPAVAYGNIYLCGGCTGYSDTGTFCVDKETLEVIWSAPAGSWTASPAVADGKVYVGGFCYDAFTGEEIFSYEQGGLSPVIANGCLFNVQNGRVVCFEDLLLDLTVSAIETPANLRSDVINPITATIENLGGLDAGSFDVSFAVDGIPVDTASVTSLAAGKNATVKFLWTPSSTGNQALTVTADASDAVTESDESNNNLSQTADVLEKLTVTANVRIEGKNDTGWTGDVTFSNSTITASDGSIHYLNEPTALGALNEADKLGGFGYVVESHPTYGLYISEVNNEPPIGWDGWMYRVDYTSPWVGAADYTLYGNEDVLWYFGKMWPLVPPLTIELDKTTVVTGQEFVATVTAETELVDNATVYADGLMFQTGPDGKATLALDTAGNYTVYADKGTWAEYTRSEKVEVMVTIPAGVTFNLKKLNSNGFLKAFITLPEGYDVADIDVSTVECEGAHVFGDGSIIPGKQALDVKFKITDLVDVPTSDAISLTVTGELTTGERFEGSNTVEVIKKEKGKK